MKKEKHRKKKESSFRGKVGINAQKSKTTGRQFGYLDLPKGTEMWSPEPGGKDMFDIIPYKITDNNHPDRDKTAGIAMKGDLWYKRPFKTHRGVGADKDTVVCLTSVREKCPICEYRVKQFKEGASKEETNVTKTSNRNLYVVVPRNSDKYEEKPYVWDMSQWNFQNLLTEEIQENEDYEVFPDLEEGLILKVRWDAATLSGSKGKPFAQASRIDFKEREEAIDEDILDKVPDLDSMLKVLSYDELEAKFFELNNETEDTEEEESSKKKKKAKEEDEEEEEEEEEEEAPKKKKIKKEASKKKGGKNKCPHGYEYGVDTEEYDECEDCKAWEDCLEEKEKEEE